MSDLTLRAALLVASGAAAGGLARWLAVAWLSRAGAFPWGTLAVNVVGSFLVGLLLFGGVAKGWVGPEARLLLAVGFLGAFTTMSAFAYETVTMLQEGRMGWAALHALGAPALSVAAAWLGRLAADAVPAA